MKRVSIRYVWETVREYGMQPEKWQNTIEFDLPEVDRAALAPVLVAETSSRRLEWVSYADRYLEIVNCYGSDPESISTSVAMTLASRGVPGINLQNYKRRGRPRPGSVSSTEEDVVRKIRDAMAGAVACGDTLAIPSGSPCLIMPLDAEGSSVDFTGISAMNPARRHLCFGFGEIAELETWCAAFGIRNGTWRVLQIVPDLQSSELSLLRLDETVSHTIHAAEPHLFRLPADLLVDYTRLTAWFETDSGRTDRNTAAVCDAVLRMLDNLSAERLLDRRTAMLLPALVSTCGKAIRSTGVENVPEEDGDAYAFVF